MEALQVYIGSRIEEMRCKKRLTQKGLAVAVGLSRASIVNAEVGRQNFPIKRIYMIAEALGCGIEELMPPVEWYTAHKNKKVKRVITFEVED